MCQIHKNPQNFLSFLKFYSGQKFGTEVLVKKLTTPIGPECYGHKTLESWKATKDLIKLQNLLTKGTHQKKMQTVSTFKVPPRKYTDPTKKF